MKRLCDMLYLAAAGNSPLFHLLRFLLALTAGGAVILKPALSLKVCALLLLPAAAAAGTVFYRKCPAPYRHRAWGFLPGAAALLLIPRQWDMAGIAFILLFTCGTLLRAGAEKTAADKAAAAGAGLAMTVLFFRMFRSDWFDLYIAAALTFWGTALWEGAHLKLIRRRS